jgi:hypothetical protein
VAGALRAERPDELPRDDEPLAEDRRVLVLAFLAVLVLREGARRFPRVRVAGIPAR